MAAAIRVPTLFTISLLLFSTGTTLLVVRKLLYWVRAMDCTEFSDTRLSWLRPVMGLRLQEDIAAMPASRRTKRDLFTVYSSFSYTKLEFSHRIQPYVGKT